MHEAALNRAKPDSDVGAGLNDLRRLARVLIRKGIDDQVRALVAYRIGDGVDEVQEWSGLRSLLFGERIAG